MYCQKCGIALAENESAHECPVPDLSMPTKEPARPPLVSGGQPWRVSVVGCVVGVLLVVGLGFFGGWHLSSSRPQIITTPARFSGSLDLRHGVREWKVGPPIWSPVHVVFKGMTKNERGEYGVWITNLVPVNLIPEDTAKEQAPQQADPAKQR